MPYDIVRNMAVLGTSGTRLDVKLREAVGLLKEAFAFDQCALYLRTEEGRGFALEVYSGEKTGCTRVYDEDSGVVGFVRKNGRVVELYKRDQEATAWKGRVDPGLRGYRHVRVFPLMDHNRFYGVLYLKSRSKMTLKPNRMDLLRIAVIQIVSILKFDEIVQDYKKANDELEGVRDKLLSAEKLMALGDMAASLAHEVKNPLVSVGGFAQLVKRHLKKDSPAVPYVDQMIKEIKRLEKIVTGSISYLREDLESREPGDLNEILDDAVALFTDECRDHGISVVKDFHKGALSVLADSEQLKIAFDNLIANAIQSMGKGGVLTLSTLKQQDWAVAEISDSGIGIDPRNLGSIFSPFFTTKKNGTGLGLPITNSIIMRHKGIIRVANNIGAGATFKVKLPCSDREKGAARTRRMQGGGTLPGAY